MDKRIVSIVTFVGSLCLPALSLADDNSVAIQNPLTATNFCQLLTQIATYVGTFIASLGTIMLIIAGILFMTSAGSPEKITKARTALMYAVIGIGIGLLAGAIVAIVQQTLTVNGSPGC